MKEISNLSMGAWNLFIYLIFFSPWVDSCSCENYNVICCVLFLWHIHYQVGQGPKEVKGSNKV